MTKGTNKILLTFLAFIILQLCSCNADNVFSESVSMQSEIWNLDNIAEFKPSIDDTLGSNNISFVLRTGTAYPFRNIWLFVSTESPSGKILTDTVQYFLADEKGKWYGKGFGDIRELVLPFRKEVYFPEKGVYTLSVRHGMRSENLKGVYDIGIRIDRVKK